MSGSTRVSAAQRHKRGHPCRICGGYDEMRRGQDVRCAGFISEDGEWEHCERVPSSRVDQGTPTRTYVHKVYGECHLCAEVHHPAFGGRGEMKRGGKHERSGWWTTATYPYRDAEGSEVFRVVRQEMPNATGGKPKKTFRQCRVGADGQPIWSLDGVTRVLYRLPELLSADPSQVVYVVEGEKCADALAALGCVATTASGGALQWHQTPAAREVLRGRHVVVLPDNDGPDPEHLAESYKGQRHARQVADDLAGVSASVRVLELPNLPLKGDVADWLEAGGTREELEKLSQSAPLVSEWTAPGESESSAGEDDEVGFLLSSVQTEPIDWVWQSYVPLGKLTIIDGDGGFGKTLILGDLAARITRGLPMPDGTRGVSGGVVILNAEDGVEDTLRPRLEAAGADLDRVLILETAVSFDPSGARREAPISLPRDIPTLEKAVKRVGAKAVLIDPMMSFLDGGVDAHKDQDSRAVTRPLAAFAKRAGVALVLVRHISKGGGANPQHRGIASVGWINSARSGLVVGPDPQDPEKRVLALNKTNIAPRSTPSLSYRIVGDDQASLRVEWLGISQHDARAILSQYGATEDTQAPHALQDAKSFLRDELASGEVRAKDVIGRAKDLGISKRTLDRARAELDVRAEKRGFGADAHWVWLKIANDADEGCQPQAIGNLRANSDSDGARSAGSREDCQLAEGGNLQRATGTLRADTGDLWLSDADDVTRGRPCIKHPGEIMALRAEGGYTLCPRCREEQVA
ncbi:MAG TPA: AAA family ATPase [Ktedonobacterales bacterium]